MTYLLCHGFGFENNYWKNFIPLLDSEYEFFDEIDPSQESEKEYIGIGHSLGFLKLNNSGIKFKALISLQGSLDFCAGDPKRIENIDRMIEACSKNPKNFLKFFYKACEYDEKIPESINVTKLIEDLKLLKKSCSPCGAPTLIIGSDLDKIIEKSILEKIEFAPIKYINGVNHSLGYSKPQETFEVIREFLKKC